MQHAARLFFALWPDTGVRAQLAAWQRAWQWPAAARLVPPARLHLTLHFLARVPREQVPVLARRADVPVEPFDLVLDRAGLWPAGVAWLGPSAVPAGLLALHARIGTALQALGCELETRSFKPHVTFARDAQAAAPAACEPLRWRVDGYVLVESRPGDEGGYQVLSRYGGVHR